MSIGRDFAAGLMFWWRGWRHLFSRRDLLRVAMGPVLIVVATAAAALTLLFAHLGPWARWLLAQMNWSALWTHYLYYPLLFSAGLLVTCITVYVAFILQGVVAMFFHAILADRTLAQQGKKADDRRVGREWAKHTVRMILTSLLKAVLFLLLGAVFFVFSFIPGLNAIALVGTMALLAFDCMDYSFEALGFGLRRRIAYMFRQWPQWAGMATALALTLLIPGLTLLIVPGAVVGAALIIKVER